MNPASLSDGSAAKRLHSAVPAICFLLAALAASPFSPAVLAQSEPQWSRLGPEGGVINVVVIDPANSSRLYAGSFAGGVFVSEDRAATWRLSNAGLDVPSVQALVLDPANSALYAGVTTGGVFRSLDGGRTWSSFNQGLTSMDVAALAVGPGPPSRIYAGASDGIFVSVDGGSWSALGALPREGNLGISAIVTHPTDPSILYASTSTYPGPGLFRSRDGGASWERIDQGVVDYTVMALAVVPDFPSRLFAATFDGGVFRSTDGGDTWKAVNSGLGENPVVWALTVDPANPSVVFAGTQEGVYRSADSGMNWQLANRPIADTGIRMLVVDPTNSSMLYLAASDGLYRSVNSGASWDPAQSGLDSWEVNDVAIDASAPDVIFAGTARSVYRSRDGGVSWSDTGPLRASSLAIDPSLPSRIYAGGNGVSQSDDGGDHWRSISSGLMGFRFSTLVVDEVAVSPADTSVLYCLASGGAFRRSGNLAWARLTELGATLKALALHPGDSSILYVGSDRGVFRSVDSGESWMALNSGLGVVDELGLSDQDVTALVIHPLVPSILYAGSRQGGVFRSRNGGQSWTAVNRGLSNLTVRSLAVHPLTPSVVYAGTEEAVFQSLDEGENWRRLNRGLETFPVTDLQPDPVDPSLLYGATAGAGVVRIVADYRLRFPQVADGRAGEEQISTQIVLLNSSPASSAQAALIARDDEGVPFDLLNEPGDNSSPQALDIAPGALAVLSSDGGGDVVEGAALVVSNQPLTGFLLYQGGSGVAGLANSPEFERAFLTPVEVNPARAIDTGFAAMNLEEREVTLDLSLVDAEGQPLAEAQLRLPALGHTAGFVRELLGEAAPSLGPDEELRGVLRVEASGRVSAVAIQTRPGEFVAFPVERLTRAAGPVAAGAAGGSDHQLVFAHFGNGTVGDFSVSSQLLLVNLDRDGPAETTVEIRDSQGQPLQLELNQEPSDGRIELSIPPGGLRRLETSGSGPVLSGSVRVASNRPVAGILIFSGSAGAAGVGAGSIYERGFDALFERQETANLKTGIALTNLEDVAQEVAVTLLDERSRALASARLDLAPQGQRALFVDEFEWDNPNAVRGARHGLLRAFAAGRITATVIRTLPGQFATLPVFGNVESRE